MARTKKAPLPKVAGFHFNESAHAYTFDGKPLMGVTSVLGVIAKPALIQWAANMACDYIRDNFPTTDALLQNPKAIAELIEIARKAHAKKRDTAAEAGTDLHAVVEAYVNRCLAGNNGLPLPIVEQDKPAQAFVEWATKEGIRFIASEHRMYSTELCIAGTADLIFEKDGKLYVGDVKTYKKIWDRVPFIQCAAYGMMYEYMNPTAQQIAGYCIIRIKDTEFETMWSFDRSGDTEAFLSALRLYTHLKNFAR